MGTFLLTFSTVPRSINKSSIDETRPSFLVAQLVRFGRLVSKSKVPRLAARLRPGYLVRWQAGNARTDWTGPRTSRHDYPYRRSHEPKRSSSLTLVPVTQLAPDLPRPPFERVIGVPRLVSPRLARFLGAVERVPVFFLLLFSPKLCFQLRND